VSARRALLRRWKVGLSHQVFLRAMDARLVDDADANQEGVESPGPPDAQLERRVAVLRTIKADQ
jgi:hypothetical protein